MRSRMAEVHLPGRLTLLLTLSLLSADARGAETCSMPAGDPSNAGGSTFILLIGYPRATTEPDLPELAAVGDDVLRMMQFFEPLRPDKTIVHLERSPRIDARLGGSPRPPTLAAIERSVDELIASLRTAPEPHRIYVYYAGHGQQGWSDGRPRTRLFLAPQPGSNAPGADGVLDADLLANRILGPLGRYGTVHFIADACQSWFLLEVRGVTRRVRMHKRRPADEPEMTRAFARRLPSVGALLATSGSQVTYEDPSLGGLFSHALRSAALGPGDLNGDGRVTYRELDYSIEWILGGRAGSTTPGLHPPGGADDAVFIDWTAAPDAAPVCFERAQGRYQLLSEDYGPLATIHAGQRPVAAWLSVNRELFAFGRAHPTEANSWWKVTVSTTTFTEARRRPETQPMASRGDRFTGLFARPLDHVATQDLAQVETHMPIETPSSWAPRPYLGIGAQVGLDFPVVGAPGVEQAPVASLGLRLGEGRHQLLLDLHWSQWDGETTTAAFPASTRCETGDCPPEVSQSPAPRPEGTAEVPASKALAYDATQPYLLDRAGVLAGYGFVIWDGVVDIALTGRLGASVAIKGATDISPRAVTSSLDGRTGLMLHWPLPEGSPLAARLDAYVGYHGLVVDQAVGKEPSDLTLEHALSVGALLGLEWEEPL